MGGSGASAGATGVGGCVQAPCINIGLSCPDGNIVTPPCGCPECSCEGVECGSRDCEPWQVVTHLPGACCDSCETPPPPPECAGAPCIAPLGCEVGFELTREPGACCNSCRLMDRRGCCELGCPPAGCPPGYAPDPCLGGCVPDPNWCKSSADCVLAVDVSLCCACPEAASARRMAENPCLVPPGSTLPIPAGCDNHALCDSIACEPCPEDPGGVLCDRATCVATQTLP